MSLEDVVEGKLKEQIDRTEIDCYRTDEDNVACKVSRDGTRHAVEVRHQELED